MSEILSQHIITLHPKENPILRKCSSNYGESLCHDARGEYQPVSLKILHLVNESTCSAYDCEFVALASELDIPLVTVDKQIRKQFPNTAISLDEFVG
jgi:hypothetical protein